MTYYPEPESHFRDKVKEVLELSNYTTKTELNDTADADTSNLAATTDFVALNPKVDKVDINKLIKVLSD